MKKYLIIILTALMAALSAQAQIPAEVAEVMKKSDAAMTPAQAG